MQEIKVQYPNPEGLGGITVDSYRAPRLSIKTDGTTVLIMDGGTIREDADTLAAYSFPVVAVHVTHVQDRAAAE